MVILAILGFGPALAQEGATLDGFKIPEYTDAGVKKSELTGDSARLMGSMVEITGLTITFFDMPTTNIKMKVSAPQCSYNRRDSIAKSPERVRIEGDKMVVTGKDFAWDGTKEQFKIFSDAKVVLTNVRDRTDTGAQQAKGESNEE